MSRRLSQEFWSRAHLSREVFEIMKALDAIANARAVTRDIEVLRSAIALLDAALEGRRTIGRPELSPRWALNAWKFRSAAHAVATMSAKSGSHAAVQDDIDRVKQSLEAVITSATVPPAELALARDFFKALQEILLRTFGSPQEYPPVKYV